jgi:tRNA/rRNA methyltransferase/tRNA (cytidine32/uridine32-2'-O)-methyltransferase
MSDSRLDAIRVVLYEPQDLVNVAATVRAMKNMGLADLRLVRPALFDSWRVQGIAHDTADIVDRVRVSGQLDGALADCVLVAAFTARRRAAKWTIVTPRDGAGRLLDATADGPVALLFGREDRGLPNDALDRAQLHVTIPTTAYASLNLAQAVIVALYELHVTAGDVTRPRRPPRKDAPPPAAEELERYYADAERALEAIDFFKTRFREHVLRSLRSLTARAGPNARELSLLRAMAIEVVKKLERVSRAPAGRPPADGSPVDL